MAFCIHDSTSLRSSCMNVPHQAGMWLSASSRNSQAGGGLQEFQFFGHDDTVDRSLGLPQLHHSPMIVEPTGIKYQKNPCSNIPLTLDISSTTTTTTSSPITGSRPQDIPVVAQVASSASAVSLWGSSGRAKEVSNNKPITGQGDSAAEREAKILRYREKKAMRNYEKQVRYESRKKYAEIRPRVRGRFAKNSTSEQPSSAAPEYNSTHYGTGCTTWFSLSP
ncbi:hypothetical protein NE237_029027 [Protea cynaroides]|uniref:CCT domain-containing protein n=1 Tax=Protea cynaroides TaxID=273540 RepID=A0A9Q0GTJ7_9MAGN|nr:hypothetical protein NE237_029027 [Protea cynaroides]